MTESQYHGLNAEIISHFYNFSYTLDLWILNESRERGRKKVPQKNRKEGGSGLGITVKCAGSTWHDGGKKEEKNTAPAPRDDPKANMWVSSGKGRGKPSSVQAGRVSASRKEGFCCQQLKLPRARTSLVLLGEQRSGAQARWTSSSNIISGTAPTGLDIPISNLESDLSRVDSGIRWEYKPGFSLKV